MSYRALKLAAAALAAAATLAPTAANAQYYGRGGGYGSYYAQQAHDRGADRRGYERYAQYDRRDYGRGRRQAEYRDDRGYRDGRNYRNGRQCDRGTGGTIIGAIAGGLLGNAVVGRGDRGAGTIVGAGVGALAGRSIDRDC